MAKKESKSGETRRSFLVKLWGIAAGTFLLPRLDGGSVSGDIRSNTDKSVEETIRKLITKPTKVKLRNNAYHNFYLNWMEDTDEGVKLMLWLPNSKKEEAEALKFFEAMRDFMLPLEEKPLGEKVAGSVNRIMGRKRRSKEERAMIEELLDDIDNSDLWIAYGTWLEEQGDLYGEFIKLTTLRRDTEEDDPSYEKIVERYAELYFGHKREFIRPLEEVGLQPIFNGEVNPRWWLEDGAVMELTIDKPGILPERAEEFFEAAPFVIDIKIKPECVDIIPFTKLPQIAQFQYLRLHDIELSLKELEALTQTPHLRRLGELDLSSNFLGPEAGSILAKAQWLPQIFVFELSRCDLGDEGLAALVESLDGSQIRKLYLTSNGLTTAGVKTLAESPNLPELGELLLAKNSLDAEAIEALGKSKIGKTIVYLDLDECELGPAGMAAMKTWNWPELWALHIPDNDITNAGLEELADWPGLAELTDLRLGFNKLDAKGIESLVRTKYTPELAALYLQFNEIGDEGAKLLADWEGCKKLDWLDLSSCGIGDAGIESLAQSEALQNVDQLNLRNNPFGLRGALALAKSPYLQYIEDLNLSEIKIPQRGRNELSKRFDDEVLSMD